MEPWIPRGDTPSELAAVVGIDGEELERTIERWNALCVEGHDPDFGRGDSAFDGPRVDPDARVLDLDGEPIAGLYAAGNVMGSPFGMTYGGPGGTLGPAMVFGYLAGRHAVAR